MFESLTPNLFVSDIARSIAFYKKLGFSVAMSVPEDGNNVIWAMLVNGKAALMFQSMASLEEDIPHIDRNSIGGSLLLYIKIGGIRSFFERVKDSAEVIHGLRKAFYGATEFTIADPDGYVLTFAEDEA
jgi:uncharacterized glyoxalase superfamily protein PhnB